MHTRETDKFEELVRKFQPESKLIRTWELEGGISAQVTGLEVDLFDGQTRKMIVRQHGTVDLEHNPHVAADEYRLLQILHSVGLAAPAPYYFDQSGEIFPTPYIVIEYIEGKSDFAPANLDDFTLQLATQLSKIHSVDSSVHDLSFLARQEEIVTRRLSKPPLRPDETLDVMRIWDTLHSTWPLTRGNSDVLLHGDFWPGNILWNRGNLAAVIDWEDAQVGDALGDLANSRLEILWAFGSEAMGNFTRQYRSLIKLDFTNLPFWDLYAALRHAEKSTEWSTYEADEQLMRDRHKLFTAQALKNLSK